MHCLAVNYPQKVLPQEKFRPCLSRASEPLNFIMNIMDPTMRSEGFFLTLCRMILVLVLRRAGASFFRDTNRYFSLKKPDTAPFLSK